MDRSIVASADEPSLGLVELLTNLRARVTDYVRERRAQGDPVERVIPQVGRLVHEAESLEGWLDDSGTLMAQMVWWSISAYYDEPERQHGPRVS